MFRAESSWLRRQLSERRPEELSPLLNVGSSTRAFREKDQPWIERELFAPLRARGVKTIHLDLREGDGIDIRADILDAKDLERIKALRPKAILCCNILEHVVEPGTLAARCEEIVGPGGLIFVTVPFSYPHHRDPIDTLFRPSPEVLAALFRGATMVHSQILDAGESYLTQVKKRPLILFRHVFLFPFPFVNFTKWRNSMAKLYWLLHNYKVTVAVFQVAP